MKILHAFDLFTPRGGGTVAVIHKISRALSKKGHEVTIYASDYKLDKDYIASIPEVKVFTVPCLSKAGNYYYMPAMDAELKKHLRDFQVVHLHCFRSYQNIKIHKYAVKYNVPYIIDAHGSLPRTSEQAKNFKWLLKCIFDITIGNRILRDAGKVIAETTKAVEEYREFGVEDNEHAPKSKLRCSKLLRLGHFAFRYRSATRTTKSKQASFLMHFATWVTATSTR